MSKPSRPALNNQIPIQPLTASVQPLRAFDENALSPAGGVVVEDAPIVMLPGPNSKGFLNGRPARLQSLKLVISTLNQANTAVKYTSINPTGYQTLNELVNGAIERELDRLATIYREGQPFDEAGYIIAGNRRTKRSA